MSRNHALYNLNLLKLTKTLLMAQLMAFLGECFCECWKSAVVGKVFYTCQSQLLINVSQVFCILVDFLSRIS